MSKHPHRANYYLYLTSACVLLMSHSLLVFFMIQKGQFLVDWKFFAILSGVLLCLAAILISAATVNKTKYDINRKARQRYHAETPSLED